MTFTDHEWVWIFKRMGLSDDWIAVVTGFSVRTISNIKNAKGAKACRCPDVIDQKGFENVELPWPQDAHTQIRRIDRLMRANLWQEIHECYAFSAKHSLNEASAMLQKDVEDVSTLWAHALFAYSFHRAMQFSPIRHHIDIYRNCEEWCATTEIMLSLLNNRDEDWANILRFKVSANRVTAAWKHTNVSDRTSNSMKALLKSTDYCAAVLEYNNLIPLDVVAPFNALAVASQFRARDQYAELHIRLCKADEKYADPLNIKDEDFDDDFEDFKDWFKSQSKAA